MAIVIEVRPEVEAELARQAAAHGRPLEAYAATLLEEASHIPQSADNRGVAAANNIVELFAPVRGLLADEEIDRIFSRNPSTGRPLANPPGSRWALPAA